MENLKIPGPAEYPTISSATTIVGDGRENKSDEHALSKEQVAPAPFSEPNTIPLPDSGHHSIGVVFEDLTIFGSGATGATVEGLEISMLKVSFVLFGC